MILVLTIQLITIVNYIYTILIIFVISYILKCLTCLVVCENILTNCYYSTNRQCKDLSLVIGFGRSLSSILHCGKQTMELVRRSHRSYALARQVHCDQDTM